MYILVNDENISNIKLYIFLIKALYSIYIAHKAYRHRELVWILCTFNDILRGGHNPKHYQVGIIMLRTTLQWYSVYPMYQVVVSSYQTT